MDEAIMLDHALDSQRRILFAVFEEERKEMADTIEEKNKRIAELETRLAIFERLADARSRLLVNYRIGTRRGIDKTLDALHRAENDLAALGKGEDDGNTT